MSKITTEKAFNSRLKNAGKENVLTLIRDCSAFMASQVNKENEGNQVNTAPLSRFYAAIPSLAAKPKGVTQSNLRAYAESVGLVFNKKTQSFRVSQGANLQTFEADWFTGYVKEPVQASLEDRAMANLTRAIKQYRECGLSDEAISEKLVRAFELAQTE